MPESWRRRGGRIPLPMCNKVSPPPVPPPLAVLLCAGVGRRPLRSIGAEMKFMGEVIEEGEEGSDIGNSKGKRPKPII